MVFLTSCWFVIEKVIIPDGHVKWHCLSYFVFPAILVFVQMFLFLQNCLLLVFSSLVSFCRSVFGLVIGLITCFTVYFQSLDAAGCDEEDQFFDIIDDISSLDAIIVADSPSSLAVPMDEEIGLFEEVSMEEYAPAQEIGDFEEMMEDFDKVQSDNNTNQEADADDDSHSHSSNLDPIPHFPDSPVPEYGFMEYSNTHFASTTTDSPITSETESQHFDDNSSIDPFYMEYTDKMRWFDLLNDDRNSMMVEKSDDPISSMPWKSTLRNDLQRRTLEYEFEIIYVAQLCLSWEALHHQYRMVEQHLQNSSTKHGFFYTNVAGEFQKFHVLLHRFMEEECNGSRKRYLNYVQKRFLDKTFLQVPQLSGFYEAKHGTMGEAMNDGRQVLKAIEECVKTYFEFVKMDKKYSWWKLKSKLWTLLPIQDPKDLDLLMKVTRMLRLKEFLLKDLTGKKRCWCNKRVTTVHVGDFDAGKEMLFSMINLKLVRRVLDLYIVKTSQLNWCKDKLNSITFMRGSVSTISFIRPMFPT